MKKTVLLIVGFVFISQLSVFAEINKVINGDQTSIESYWITKYQVMDNGVVHDCRMQLNFSKWNGSNDIEILIFGTPYDQDNKNKLIVFSMHNSPMFHVVTNKIIPVMSSITGLNQKYYIKGVLNKEALSQVYTADVAYIVFPSNDGGTKKFEIPREIISEWQMVMDADLKTVRKELMEK